MHSTANDTCMARRRLWLSSQLSLHVLLASQSELDQTAGRGYLWKAHDFYILLQKRKSFSLCLPALLWALLMVFFPSQGVLYCLHQHFPSTIQGAWLRQWLHHRQIPGNWQPPRLTWQAHVRAIILGLTATHGH